MFVVWCFVVCRVSNTCCRQLLSFVVVVLHCLWSSLSSCVYNVCMEIQPFKDRSGDGFSCEQQIYCHLCFPFSNTTMLSGSAEACQGFELSIGSYVAAHLLVNDSNPQLIACCERFAKVRCGNYPGLVGVRACFTLQCT